MKLLKSTAVAWPLAGILMVLKGLGAVYYSLLPITVLTVLFFVKSKWRTS
jgi:hypothetical protein